VTHASDDSTAVRRFDGIATVMCVDLQRSPELAGSLDVIRSQLDDYGGRDVPSSTHRLLAVFASPRQAVGCALAIQRNLPNAPASLRIGIDAGEVVDTDAGPEGAALDDSARIVTRAESGEVLVSDVVRQLVGNAPGVRFVDRGRLRPEGTSGLVHAWSAQEHSGGAPDRTTVGRTSDLAAMHDLITATTTATGRTMLVEGEAGIGKTHLLRTAVDLAARSGTVVVDVVADDVTRRIGALPHAVADHPAISEEFRRPLSELLARSAVDGDIEDLSFAVVEATVDAVESIGRKAPAMVVFDDAQWADPLSVAVLRSLVGRTATASIGLLVALRLSPRSTELDRMIDDVVDRGGDRIRLGPLEEVDVQSLSMILTGAAPGPRLRSRLEAAGGNPLFTTELLRALDDEGLLHIESGVAEVSDSAAPVGLSESLVRRLSWLPVDTRELLRIASLLGTSFTLADVAVITARPVIDVAAALREASVAGLISGDGDRLVFRHDLVREAVYEHMLPAERRDLHRAAGRAFAASGAPTQQVAIQFGRAARSGDLEAVEWLHRAADEIVAIAPSAAIELYQQALSLAPELWDGRGAIMADLIEPLAWCGQFEQAEQMATAVLAISPGDDVVFRALRGLSSVYGNRGETPMRWRRSGGPWRCPTPTRRRSARLTCFSAQLEVMTGAITAEEALARGTEGLARAVERADATGQCVAHQVLGAIYSFTGFGDLALKHSLDAVALFDSGKVRPTSYLIPEMFHAGELAELDRLDEAIEHGASARARYQRRGALAQVPMSYAITSAAHYYAGRFDDALAELEAGLAVIADTGSTNFVLYLLALQARIAVHRGEHDVAEQAISEGFARLGAGGPPFGADWLLDAHVEHLATTGDAAAALAAAELTWEQTAMIRHWFGARQRGVTLVRLSVDRDRPELAREAVAALEESARRRPAPSALAAVAHARGLLDDDVALVLDAVERYRATMLRPVLARCCEDAATLLSKKGQQAEASSLLSEAAAIHADIGATGDLARVDAVIGSIEGTEAGTRPKRPTFGWESLTPMELAVTELVATGLSNPEIGRDLHISRRTVESHLAHIFRKLDMSSRVQLATEFIRLDDTTRPGRRSPL
jgi:DNA-binding CsgD family transcriptional regulator/tetratricopeptide (TPR) repeat protein